MAYIEIGRRVGIGVPIPFLMLLGVVVLIATIWGMRSGIAGAIVASLFIFYSMLINFGPETVTGGPIQVLLTITLLFVTGFFLGRMRDQNVRLTKSLEERHLELERLVTERTAELTAANESLSREMAERIQIEQQVQRQERLAVVGQLAAGIAHDFNNVMAVIVLYSQLLSVSPNLTNRERKQIQTIFEEGKRAAALTSQILDFGRQSVLERQSLNLLPFLKEFVKLLRRTLPESIEINLTYEEEDYFVTADPTRLQQALMNLALNSRDAMPKGGRIHIKLTHLDFQSGEQKPIPDPPAGEWVKIIVADNGNGIPPADQDHLFEPFFTTKEPGKGTGLGLAQVYGIVKQHNGFIGVESDPGWGTVFTITLPVGRDGESTGQVAATDTAIGGNGELILVVEDNSATRFALMAALEFLNYTVKGVENGVEALVLLRRHRSEIVLVLSDVVMPKMGGIALL
ncbi:MAG: ATP-binding protein, partial [Candidatus Promineifilaceae bacterium]